MKYFKEEEFKNYSKLDSGLLEKLDKFREIIGKPVRITSDYSEGTGHSVNSQHYYGRAIDGVCVGARPFDVLISAVRAGFSGIGIYTNGYFHLDVRTGDKAFWIGLNGKDGIVYIDMNESNFVGYVLTGWRNRV